AGYLILCRTIIAPGGLGGNLLNTEILIRKWNLISAKRRSSYKRHLPEARSIGRALLASQKQTSLLCFLRRLAFSIRYLSGLFLRANSCSLVNSCASSCRADSFLP